MSMSHAKDKRRAEAGNPVVNQPTPSLKCPFPGCGKVVNQEDGKMPLCDYHRQFVADWVYAMSHVKVQQVQQKPQAPRIVLPGYMPTQHRSNRG